MGPFDCAPLTLAACQAVLRRLSGDDLARPSPCAEYTVGEVGQHLVRSMVLLASVAGEQADSPVAGTLITEDKRGRSFAAEVPAGPDATALHRLIAFTGRAP